MWSVVVFVEKEEEGVEALLVRGGRAADRIGPRGCVICEGLGLV